MADLHLDRIDHFLMAATDLAPAYAALTQPGRRREAVYEVSLLGCATYLAPTSSKSAM